MKPQAYFSYLEFDRFDVRSLEPIEMFAEKVRAAFQRVKVRISTISTVSRRYRSAGSY